MARSTWAGVSRSPGLRALTLQSHDLAAEQLLARIAEPLRVAARADAVSFGEAAHPSRACAAASWAARAASCATATSSRASRPASCASSSATRARSAASSPEGRTGVWLR